jgi:hypothetical protein
MPPSSDLRVALRGTDASYADAAEDFTSEQVENLKKVLSADPRPIQRAWFVTNGPVSSTITEQIRLANEFLGGDFIKVISNVGDYP